MAAAAQTNVPAPTPAPPADFVARGKDYCSENLAICVAPAVCGFVLIVTIALLIAKARSNKNGMQAVEENLSQNWMISSAPVAVGSTAIPPVEQNRFAATTNNQFKAADEEGEELNVYQEKNNQQQQQQDDAEDEDLDAYLNQLENDVVGEFGNL